MKILVVKLSAMGDIIHALPAITDASNQGAVIHWLVDERFAAIPSWHPGVAKIIPLPLHRWKKAPLAALAEVAGFIKTLRREPYDRVVDLQGLVKSGVVASLAHGERIGPQKPREALAAWCYHRTVPVAEEDHVLLRLRKIMATALNSPEVASPLCFGLDKGRLPLVDPAVLGGPFILFLHGAAWSSKLWPTAHWQALARLLADWPVTIGLPWGNPVERLRAEEIAQAAPAKVRVLPAMTLANMAALIARARGVVGLDSGFAHLAAALDVPVVTLFGATNPAYSGVAGGRQRFIQSQLPCAPCMERTCGKFAHPRCFDEISPQQVAQRLAEVLDRCA